MAIYCLGPLIGTWLALLFAFRPNSIIGPVVGPIAGGFIAQTIGFKYVFIVIVGISAIASIIGIPFLRETYAPVIRLRRRAKRSLDPEKAAELHPALAQAHGSKVQLIWLNLSRPVILLTRYGSRLFCSERLSSFFTGALSALFSPFTWRCKCSPYLYLIRTDLF
jgi:MFS family permease